MSGRILPICENLVENTSVKSFDSGSLSSRIKRNMDYRAKKKMMKRLSLHDAAWESQRVRVYIHFYINIIGTSYGAFIMRLTNGGTNAK